MSSKQFGAVLFVLALSLIICMIAKEDAHAVPSESEENIVQIYINETIDRMDKLFDFFQEKAQSKKMQDQFRRKQILDRAYAELGKPYVWGACGPRSFDCSGLVSYCVLGEYGKRLGTTHTFMRYSRTYDPQPGDICTTYSHCGIYIGNGQMIHAPRSGDVVKIGPVFSSMIYVTP